MATETRTRVTVFGAGISGLTAAHELAIRGFAVTVVDPVINPSIDASTLDRGIGGMARSQFVVDPGDRIEGRPTELRPAAEYLLDTVVRFADGDVVADVDLVATVKRAIANLRRSKRLGGLQIIFPVRQLDPQKSVEAQLPEQPNAKRLAVVKTWLHECGVTPAERRRLLQLTEETDPRTYDTIRFSTGRPIMPAEHGFRFFPSFYRHLFDTMKRTRIVAPRSADGGSTVYDNLVPVDGLGFAREGARTSFLGSRHPLRSLEEFRQTLDRVLGELEWTGSDLTRLSLKLFEYMTSCSARRATEYENTSWSDFVDADAFSSTMQEHIEFGTQVMLSLRGSKSDARTQGNTIVQLLLDHIREGTRPDATLGAPTSGAWFDHWHRFLLGQDVVFRRGTVTLAVSKSGKVEPRVRELKRTEYEADYYVLALPVSEMAELARALPRGRLDADDARDLEAITEFLPEGTVRNAEGSPLRDMSGIQFFFDTDVRFWRGHTQYMDSEWGLTSIAQPQFWFEPRDGSSNYRSVLSVDIGIWDRETRPELGKTDNPRWAKRRGKKGNVPVTAWDVDTADVLATEVWAQIEDHHDQAFAAAYGKMARFPYPTAFALDQALDLRAKENRYPFLVNIVGQFGTRPGAISPSAPKTTPGYAVCDGIVMAGTHMQTYTRITSMEAANESARHAVNAILEHADAACDRCEIWDPEDHEIPNLHWLRELDEKLLAKGLPHFVRVLGWTELPTMLPTAILETLAERGGAK